GRIVVGRRFENVLPVLAQAERALEHRGDLGVALLERTQQRVQLVERLPELLDRQLGRTVGAKARERLAPAATGEAGLEARDIGRQALRRLDQCRQIATVLRLDLRVARELLQLA